jgi:lipopolysaccharide export system protein LptC
MASHNDTHSRLVAWLKIILPLIALGMLSSIFLVSRSIDPTATLPYSQVELDERAREPRLTEPRFSGLTQDGARITLDASDMRPDPTDSGRGNATDLVARMTTPDGGTTEVSSATGFIDSGAGIYRMTGDVVITSSAGYRILADKLDGTLDAAELTAEGSVKADAPMGTITSDRLNMRQNPEVEGDYVLVFRDNVRLVYQPPR